MRLTHYSDYSIRILIYAAVKGDQLSTITEIADSYNISRNHLMKVVQYLAQLGYIETVRGKGGGLRLIRAPSEIRLGQLVVDTERDFALVECLGQCNECVITSACGMTGILRLALRSFIDTLDRFTLADAVGDSAQVRHLLGLSAIV